MERYYNAHFSPVESQTGPDQILFTDCPFTWAPNGRTKIEIGRSGVAALTPISVPSILIEVAGLIPDKLALSTLNEHGQLKNWTYREFLQNVRTCAKAFIKLGLQRYFSVCILGHNSPQWAISYMGAIFAGGIATGIYSTNSPEACFYCAEHSNAQIIVVQDEIQLKKIQEIRHRLPFLKSVVLVEGEPSGNSIISWEELLNIGTAENELELEKRLSDISINECCSILYTSGTVGNPKGVMLSHDNIIISLRGYIDVNNIKQPNSRIMSYLPMSHIAGQGIELLVSMMIGGCLHFADKNALKGTLVQNLQRIQPTTFLGVPRVFEKLWDAVERFEEKCGIVQKYLLPWAKFEALKHNLDLLSGIPSNSWSYWLASNLILKKFRAALGLNCAQAILCGAAPLSKELKLLFLSIDIPILEVYGMTETCIHSVGAIRPSGYRIQSNGTPLTGNFTRIDNPDADGNGEILIKSRSVCMGYLKDREKTLDSRTEDGYFRSGDIGRIDEKGYLFVNGRIKEIIITTGGENISPINIEEHVKTELPFISNAMVIGDKRKYLTVLLTLKTDVNPKTTLPLDKLMPVTQTFLDSLNLSNLSTVTDVLNSGPDSKIRAAIQKGLDEVNRKATSNAQKVQKFVILPKDFSVLTGELGPTLKLKRHFVANKYESVIDNLYK